MQTVQPCVTIGSYVWAQDRLPYDEFTLRLHALRAVMERNGWPAVLVYGDVREHAALAFLSSFIPRVRWGMALLPRTGDARLLCAMSTRDLPAMRTLTWIADVRSGMGPEWEKAFDPWVERFKGDQAQKLGTLGFDIMAPVLHAAVRRSLGDRFAWPLATRGNGTSIVGALQRETTPEAAPHHGVQHRRHDVEAERAEFRRLIAFEAVDPGIERLLPFRAHAGAHVGNPG